MMSCKRNDGFQAATAGGCVGAATDMPRTPRRTTWRLEDRFRPVCGLASRLPLPHLVASLRIAAAPRRGQPPDCHCVTSRASLSPAGEPTPHDGGRPPRCRASRRRFLAGERMTRREKHHVVAAATLLVPPRSIDASLATGARQPMNLRKLLSSQRFSFPSQHSPIKPI